MWTASPATDFKCSSESGAASQRKSNIEKPQQPSSSKNRTARANANITTSAFYSGAEESSQRQKHLVKNGSALSNMEGKHPSTSPRQINFFLPSWCYIWTRGGKDVFTGGHNIIQGFGPFGQIRQRYKADGSSLVSVQRSVHQEPIGRIIAGQRLKKSVKSFSWNWLWSHNSITTKK